MITQYFKRADKGFCPTYHSPDGVMYWIQDHKIKHFNGGGEYEYDFMCRKENLRKTITRAQLKNLIAQNDLKLMLNCSNGTEIYTDGKDEYIYRKQEKTLMIIHFERTIKGCFPSFEECMKYAENYIAEKYYKTAEQMTIDDYIIAKEE
jgi:hypothetical protein